MTEQQQAIEFAIEFFNSLPPSYIALAGVFVGFLVVILVLQFKN